MSETKSIKVLLANGAIRDCTIEISNVPSWHLVFFAHDLGSLQADGEDLFDALIALRHQLEDRGALLLCAGARPDVFPSGMSRGMGGGRKAYVTHIGAPALKSDLIDIFDYADPNLVGTVAQQKKYHEKWVESFRS